MPATEETYRSQSTLHVVFAISSVAMLLATVWMILADHLRPWKQVQRQFFQIEDAKLHATEQQKLQEQAAKHQKELDALDQQIAQAEQQERENSRAIRDLDDQIAAAQGLFDKLDTERKFQKAEIDSQRSFYDGMIDRDEVAEANRYLNTVIVASEQKYEQISHDFEVAEKNLNKLKAQREDLRGHIDELKKKREDLTREVERVRRVIKQKEQLYGEGTGVDYYWNRFWAAFRGMPLIDMAAPPVKIQQITLPELTINYNFKDVPRFDRCTTCHLGIDKLGYDKDANGQPMLKVFASHPHLTDGATSINPKGQVVKAGLYLDANGPHPINYFGCTICHSGQGSGTDFVNATHTPNDLVQQAVWEEKYGWHEIEFWDEPMLPRRFLESSCLKCHYQVTDIPQAAKLQAGYRRIIKYGCTGCHTIGGQGSVGPDLTDARQVGPNLSHVASKVSEDWLRKWIKNPHAFRPDTRMPKFYGVSNNDAPDDWPKNHAEIHAIAHYLWKKSTPPKEFVDPPAAGNAERGKELFLQKGCMACHSHKEYGPESFPDWASRGIPSHEFARADFGPNLSNVAAKFQSKEQGQKWLANWIKEPQAYHSKTLMPSLQLSWQDAADIAAWIISIPGEWPTPVDVPPVNDPEVRKALDELVTLYKKKSEPLSQVSRIVSTMTQDEKLMYLGEKTIGRLGCFGCHTIPGFENYKPIGTPLNGWGFKSPAKLDFGHINEFMVDNPNENASTPDEFKEQIFAHSRVGFLYQKLHRPRSYDYRKTKEDLRAWDERLRMPQFTWADDPVAIEEVMTFVLGLTGEKINAKYLPQERPSYRPVKAAVAQGERVLVRYNCEGCHTLTMPRYTIAAGTRIASAIPDFETSAEVSYRSRANDYLELYPDLSYDPKGKPSLEPDDGEREITLEGMPVDLSEDILTVQLWKPVTIRGHTFNIGDNVPLTLGKVKVEPPRGGNFAWLYAISQAEATGTDFASLWNRLPPPLIREGQKVQTPWLTGFLKDPYPIRPAVNLRMPRFHYESPQGETRDLANFFAARDGAEFPYQDIPEREQAYLAKLEETHKNYLTAGWQIITKGACIQCHAIGQFKPTGGAQVVNGPDLRQVSDRFRPDYLTFWLARPLRMVPYTAMPQNIPPHGPPAPFVPKGFEDQTFAQVQAMRDTLLNYVTAIEQQLASQQGEGDKAPPPKPASGGGQ
jgi:mono/diheme cytochrome c family protein/peptidoglycan hydrolase CwlO-like protein